MPNSPPLANASCAPKRTGLDATVARSASLPASMVEFSDLAEDPGVALATTRQAGRRREADLLTEALPARRTGAARRLMVVAMAFMVVRVVDFTIRCFVAPSEWSSAGDGDG